MRFSCERCGKKYAAADPPAPGKIYKLKCKACGHLIVVRAGASTSAGPAAQPQASGVAAPMELATPAGAPLAPAPGTATGPRNGASASAAQVPGEAAGPAALGAASPSRERPPAPGDSGWVDLFSDLAPVEDEEGAGASEDPLLAAARNSLPEGYGSDGRAPDPLGAPGAKRGRGAGAVSAKRTVIPRPPPRKSGFPIVLIGAGVAVLVGILAVVLLRPGPKAPVPAPQRAVQAQAQPAPPLPTAMPVPAQVPAAAPAPEAQPPAAPPAGEGGGLTQAQIESALRSARSRFDACLQDARGTDPRLDGRRVTLLLEVQPSGAVTHPTLDDAALGATDLGSCLKSAARHAAFPTFEGNALRLEVPIVLR